MKETQTREGLSINRTAKRAANPSVLYLLPRPTLLNLGTLVFDLLRCWRVALAAFHTLATLRPFL